MITRRAFLAHLMASGAYANAAVAAPRFLFSGAGDGGSAIDETAVVESLQSIVADQTWRMLPVVAGGSLDVSSDHDIFLQFGDALVDRVAAASTSIYYPASSFGSEPIGVPAGATNVAVRAVQANATVDVMTLGSPVTYGGANIALRFDGQTAYSLTLPQNLLPPFSIFCRFRSPVVGTTSHVVALGRWGTSVSQRALRAAGVGRMQVQESARNGAQSAVLFDTWAHNPGGTQPLWSVVGGSWRPSGVPGKGRYAHNSSGEFFSLSDVADPTGQKGAPAANLIVGSDARGQLLLQGVVEWIWVVGHELSQAEWDVLKRINLDTALWPPDLVQDTVAFIPIQANAPLVDVVSGRELTLRAGAVAPYTNIGSSLLKLPSQAGPSVTIPYGSAASAPLPLPLPNKGLWRAQAHHDVRVALNGSLANASSRLIASGSGVRLTYGSGPMISVIADNPANAGALNLTALV